MWLEDHLKVFLLGSSHKVFHWQQSYKIQHENNISPVWVCTLVGVVLQLETCVLLSSAIGLIGAAITPQVYISDFCNYVYTSTVRIHKITS